MDGLRNLQGDIVGICDEAGGIVAKYEYDAWGNPVDKPDDPLYNSPIAQLNPIRYRGYYWDVETEYYYCQSRYYCPEWCRWISADVYFDTQDGIMGTNMYAYCKNNPVNYYDPSGTDDALTLIMGTFIFIALIDELPEVLHNQFAKAFEQIAVTIESAEEMISMLGTVINNTYRFHHFIGRLNIDTNFVLNMDWIAIYLLHGIRQLGKSMTEEEWENQKNQSGVVSFLLDIASILHFDGIMEDIQHGLGASQLIGDSAYDSVQDALDSVYKAWNGIDTLLGHYGLPLPHWSESDWVGILNGNLKFPYFGPGL